jgi:predicted nuclease of predicted toxin-antitoxin system
LKDRFLINECLSGDLVATAKARGYEADYVPHIGKGGWQDWNLVPFAVENDYVVVTLNRRDFLKQHANLEVHPGVVILMPQAQGPAVASGRVVREGTRRVDRHE